ncbi:multicopper oxidase family [Rhizoctonia solani]|uniref:Multicopper oxidase family n=1 Tax=Rhizoctonia solani TaxID=456999 RepID=A0A8H7LZC7_9AGAM|nr:multicopper oxidase family [Rhizoctonia solani]
MIDPKNAANYLIPTPVTYRPVLQGQMICLCWKDEEPCARKTIADGGPGREIARKEMRGGRTKTIFGKASRSFWERFSRWLNYTSSTYSDGHQWHKQRRRAHSFFVPNQWPNSGPHFVWDEGDDVSVTVINNAGDPITIHWHGIEQYGTPCLMASPAWHNIRSDPARTLYTIFSLSIRLLFYDYKHYTSEYWMSEWERTDVEQLCIDNIIVNGKGQVQCPNLDEITGLAASYQKPLTKKGYALRMFGDLVSNSGALWDLRVSIDSQLYFFAADGHYTQIQVATSVLILSANATSFSLNLTKHPEITSFVLPRTGTTGAGLVSATTLRPPRPLTSTTLAVSSTAAADLTLSLNVTRTSEFGWVLNGNTWNQPADDYTPLLFQPSEIASLDPKVYFSYANGTLVDLIFTVTAGDPAAHPPHPMHKHGVKAWLLGSGTGEFPYATIQDAVDAGYSGINIKNPPLRDDFPTPGDITGKAWMAVRFRAVDPGPVILHCHIDPTLRLAWLSVR